MNRTDFQDLAVVRIEEAEALLAAGKYDGAYYLAGYAVECALKACIAKQAVAFEFPQPVEFARKCYTHDLEKLVELALPGPMRLADFRANARLGTNWAIAKDWNEQSRYSRISEADARQLYSAVADPFDGVLRWIRNYW